MSWSALKLLGAGKWLVALAKKLGRWLLADWRNGPLLICALMWAAHGLILNPALRDARDRALAAEKTARSALQQTVNGYRVAERMARSQAEMNVARVETEQAQITQEIVDDYEARLADARARAGRIYGPGSLYRAAPARPAGGGAGAAGVPGLRDAAASAGEAPGQDRLPAAGAGDGSAAGALSAPDALIATEQALQLAALIEWVNRQAAIDVSPPADTARDLP